MPKFVRVVTNPKTGEGVFVNFELVRSMVETRTAGLDVITLTFSDGHKISTTDTIRQIALALDTNLIVTATSPAPATS